MTRCVCEKIKSKQAKAIKKRTDKRTEGRTQEVQDSQPEFDTQVIPDTQPDPCISEEESDQLGSDDEDAEIVSLGGHEQYHESLYGMPTPVKNPPAPSVAADVSKSPMAEIASDEEAEDEKVKEKTGQAFKDLPYYDLYVLLVKEVFVLSKYYTSLSIDTYRTLQILFRLSLSEDRAPLTKNIAELPNSSLQSQVQGDIDAMKRRNSDSMEDLLEACFLYIYACMCNN